MQVLLPLILYFMVVFFANMLEELTPIYASAPTRQGGLGLPLNLLAWPLSVAGAVLVVFTLYGYPSLQVRSFHGLLCYLRLADAPSIWQQAKSVQLDPALLHSQPEAVSRLHHMSRIHHSHIVSMQCRQYSFTASCQFSTAACYGLGFCRRFQGMSVQQPML